MAEILLQMENVLNMSKMGRELSESLLSRVSGLFGKNCSILQPEIELPDLTKQQCNEAMIFVPDDI